MTAVSRSALCALLTLIAACGAEVDVTPSPAATPDAAAEELRYSVILTDGGSTMIQVIKEVRAITALGLADAKELVDSVPSVVADDLSQQAAADMAARLEASGAKVEVRAD